MYASSLVRSRPKGAGQTYSIMVSTDQQSAWLQTHHGGSAVSRNGLALRRRGRGAALVDRKVAGDRPLGSADGLSSLIELGGHVKVLDGRLAAVDAIEDDKRVDFKIGEVEVDVDGVEADEEVDESLLLGCGNVLEEGVGDNLPGREGLVDGEAKLEGLGIDITNVDTALVSEENVVALSLGVDADVVLGIRRVRQERLDDEVVQRAGHRLNLIRVISH